MILLSLQNNYIILHDRGLLRSHYHAHSAERITRILILESLSRPCIRACILQSTVANWSRIHAPVSYSRHSFLLFKPQPERIANALLILASSWSIVSNILPRLLKRILLRNRAACAHGATKTKPAMITEASAEHNAIDGADGAWNSS